MSTRKSPPLMRNRLRRIDGAKLSISVLAFAGLIHMASEPWLPGAVAGARTSTRAHYGLEQQQQSIRESNPQKAYTQETRGASSSANRPAANRATKAGSDGEQPWPYVPQSPQEAVSPHIQADVTEVTIPLTSGVLVSGTVSGASPGTCVLSGTQYSIVVPFGATQLTINLNGNQDVDLFARFDQPIQIQGGQVVADYFASTFSPSESITITSATAPPLQQGTYFIGIGNCSPFLATYALTATVTVAAPAPVSLTSGVPINGSLSPASPGSCLLTAPQYTIQVPAGATQLKVDLNGDQNVDLFVRLGQAVIVQGSQVIADYSSASSSGSESVMITTSSAPPLQEGTYFIALGNCAQTTANFTLTATNASGPPPNLPNLSPFQPAGWSDKLVVSTITGTHSDANAVSSVDPIYIDWAIRNSGTVATATRFAVKLLIDGTERGSWFADPPLNTNALAVVEDFSIGTLPPGNHSIRLVADAQSDIAESSETDNEYTKNISVSARACTTLAINITPNDGGSVSSSSEATCQNPSSAIDSTRAAAASVTRTPGLVSISSSTGTEYANQSIAELMSRAERDGSVRVIVGLREAFHAEGYLNTPAAVEIQRVRIALAQDRLLSGMPAFNERSLKRFRTIPFLGLEVTAQGLRYLQNSPEVSSIAEDVAVPPALAESVPLIGAPAAWASGYTGAGQNVVILDTGVDKNHPFLDGKVVSEACYSTTGLSSSSVCPGGAAQSTTAGSGVACIATGCEHGTHVAGIAAGRGTGFSGVAKDANIIAIQVFSRFNAPSDCGVDPVPCAKSFVSDQILGLERVQALAGSLQIAAVNMSLGSGQFSSYCDAQQAARKAEIDNLRSLGIATVVSSGNNGFADSLGAPACISSAISVGSTADGSEGSTRDQVSSFSNSASFLNLLAPGQYIVSSVPGGGFASFQGTSMAAPHVTGAIAVLKSKVPSASVDRVLAALTTTGVPITDSRNGIVKPRIQLDAAVNALSPGTGPGQYNAGGIVTLTASSNPGFGFVKWQRDGSDFSTNPIVNVTMDTSHTMTAVFSNGPVISAVTLQGSKNVGIEGINFGQNPRVLINDVDRADFVRSTSPTLITLKGKQKKLGLRAGENRIQVVGDGGAGSNVFVLTL